MSNPLAVTKAYAAQFVILGGIMLKGDALTLHRTGSNWRVDTDEGPLDAARGGGRARALGAGPARTCSASRLPLAVKRGYHWHFRPHGNAGLTRPVVDTENGYCIAPMEQGLRITTGAEFAARDAPPTPVQFDRLLPAANELIPLDAPVEAPALDGVAAMLCRFAPGYRARAEPAWACGLPTGTPIGG